MREPQRGHGFVCSRIQSADADSACAALIGAIATDALAASDESAASAAVGGAAAARAATGALTADNAAAGMPTSRPTRAAARAAPTRPL